MLKKTGAAVSTNHKKKDELHDKLIDNMVQLQLIQTKLAERLDKLSNQISELLSLFEKAARSFADNPSSHQSAEKDKEFLEKINILLDQNKTIAKGLTLMEDRIRERVQETESPEQEEHYEESPAAPKPLPKF